jgi:hypothetical protein
MISQNRADAKRDGREPGVEDRQEEDKQNRELLELQSDPGADQGDSRAHRRTLIRIAGLVLLS